MIVVTLTMYDCTNVSNLPAGAGAYAGYVDGLFANLTAIERRFAGSGEIGRAHV